MDVYKAINRELFVYGSRNISGGCTSSRRTIIGSCIVRMTCYGITVDEPQMNHATANNYVRDVLNNYPMNEYVYRQNKCSAGVLYHMTVINRTNNKEELTIKILN